MKALLHHFGRTPWLATLTIMTLLTACDSSLALTGSGPETTATGASATTGQSGTLPGIYARFGNGVTVTRDADVVIIQSNGMPDHGSPYYSESSSLYESYSGTNPRFNLNPNRIREQRYTFRVPANPVEATNKSATPLGAIGVAVNGVAIYNQYAGPNRPLTNEIDSFDQYNGHPQQSGAYHYHIEPLYLTLASRESLIGVLLDGFPVYGPEENGRVITNDDLDAYHGHIGATADYPEGIYHYHVTAEDPYINGSGFFGVAGTVSQ